MEKFFPDDAYNIKIFCDGKEAGIHAGKPLDQAWGLRSQHDLLSAIWSLRSNLRCEHAFLHVDGHLDNKYAVDDLPFPNRLNVWMDTKAKAFRRSNPLLPPHEIFRQPWLVTIGSTVIASHHQDTLTEHCSLLSLNRWWVSRDRF